MPKKIKGTHVFQLLDRSHGAANNLGQSWSAGSSNPSIVGPSALPQSSTGNSYCGPRDLLHLLLLYLTHHPLPSQPGVVPSINIPLANLSVLWPPFPTPTPMTSCLFQTQTFLLTVRLAQAQSDRRSMDHQPSYQPVRDSRSSTIPSRTYWNQRRQIRDRSNENGQAPLSIKWRQWLLFRSRRALGWALII